MEKINTEQSNQDIVQKAAKSADVILSDGTLLKPWHMNEPLNGIPLDPVTDNGGLPQ